jgi:hypothetical protein
MAEPDLLTPATAQGETLVGTKLRLISKLFDRQGLEIACIAERERDHALGFCKRLEAQVFDQLTPFLTLAQLQGLALQVAAGNPKAIKHDETPHALACGFLALLAAVQAGQSKGESDAQANS